jgi:6-phosphogluconolactonase (cycloisomerase 2 family)
VGGVVLVAAFVTAPGAPAAVGDLTSLGCVDDNDAGTDACAQNTDGLGTPRGLAVSPDGTSVYVAAENDDAVAWLARDPATGALTPGGCVDDGDAGQGPDTCAQSENGLDAVEVVTVSPDGKSVYAGSSADEAVVRFDRDPTTGALTPQGCVTDNDPPANETCGQTFDGLNLVFALAVSPDGSHLYAGSINDDAIVHFSRGADGAITPQECVSDEDSGDAGCGADAQGLDSVNSLAISPDGEYLYSSAGNDNAIASLDRNPGTGELSPLGCIEDNDDGPDGCTQSTDGLEGAFSATLTVDGSSLYAGGREDDAIARFDRNSGSGMLTPQGCVEDNDSPDGPDGCAVGGDGLAGVQWVRAAPDGQSVYGAGQEDDAVAVLARDPATGAITPLGCVEDNDPPS